MEAVLTLTAAIMTSSLMWANSSYIAHNGKGICMHPIFPQMDVPNFDAQLAKQVRISPTLHFKMDLKKISIRELLDHCLRADDEMAWNEFLDRVTPTISGVVYNRVCRWHKPDRSLINDLIQDTLVKLFDKNRDALRRFEWRSGNEDAIFGYVKVIAVRIVSDHFRPANREDSLEENLDVAEDSRFSEAVLLHNLQRADIERCLEKIKATYEEKDIFWLYFERGDTAKEISEIHDFNLTVKQVETLLARLVRQVKACLKPGESGMAGKK